MATTAQLLLEAKEAYHQLRLGKGVVHVKDQNGEEVTYNKADMAGLNGYIEELQGLIDAAAGITSTLGPMRFSF